MELSDQKIKKAFDWLVKENGEGFLLSDEHCSTRDVFQGRLEAGRTQWEFIFPMI